MINRETKIEIIQALEEVKHRNKANFLRGDLFEFVKEFWGVIIKETPVWGFHIQYICQELEKITPNLINREPKLHDLLINIPPSSTKSTIVTIMFPAWLWTKDASLRILSNSHSSSISIEHASKSKDIIASDKYQKLFPEVKIRRDLSGKQAYATTQGGERRISSTGSEPTGRHAHVVINDDAQSPAKAESEKHRQQAIAQTKTLSTRKTDARIAVTITVMQRVNKKDVSQHILDTTRELKHISLPAKITSKTKPKPTGIEFKGKTLEEFYQNNLLDPIRLGEQQLSDFYRALGGRGYNGQMLQNPVSKEGDIVKEEWFDIISLTEWDRLKQENKNIAPQFFLDTAYTDSTENDPSGIIAVYKIDKSIYITAREKVYKNFPELIEWLKAFVERNDYSRGSTIRIEPKASGLSVIQTLKKETNLNVAKTPTPKDSKKTRLHAVSPKIESGRVVLVEGFWNREFLDEVCGFPNAEHDEDVDVLYYAIDKMLNKEKIKIEW